MRADSASLSARMSKYFITLNAFLQDALQVVPQTCTGLTSILYRTEVNPVQDFGQTCTRIWGGVYIFFTIAKLLIIRHLAIGENKSCGSSAAAFMLLEPILRSRKESHLSIFFTFRTFEVESRLRFLYRPMWCSTSAENGQPVALYCFSL